MKNFKEVIKPKNYLQRVSSAKILGIFGMILLASVLYWEASFPIAAQMAGNGTNTAFLPYLPYRYSFQTVFGVEMNPIANSQGLEKMYSAGANWVRRNSVLWSMVEPVRGRGYDWSVLSALEHELLLARHNRMEPILIIHGVPEWARVPPYYRACGPINPSALPAFGEFIYALVQKYSSAPYHVKYWEIWNEPDVDPSLVDGSLPFGCMGDKDDAQYYGGQYFSAVLQTASLYAKAANPDVKIVLGGLLLHCNPNDPPFFNPQNKCVPSRYLEGILTAGGKNYFDGVSFHAYDYFSIGENAYPNGIYGNPYWNSGGFTDILISDLKPIVVVKSQYIRELLAAYGASEKFLMNTETGLLCGGAFDPPGGPGCESTTESPFEQLKAAYVPQTYAAAIAEGLLANIWYTPRGWRNTGLLNSDLTPRPAYHAYVLARNTLKNATFVREVNEFSTERIYGYEFIATQRKIWVIWALDGKSHAINLPFLPVAVWDELGLPVDYSGGTLVIDELKTFYIHWR